MARQARQHPTEPSYFNLPDYTKKQLKEIAQVSSVEKDDMTQVIIRAVRREYARLGLDK